MLKYRCNLPHHPLNLACSCPCNNPHGAESPPAPAWGTPHHAPACTHPTPSGQYPPCQCTQLVSEAAAAAIQILLSSPCPKWILLPLLWRQKVPSITHAAAPEGVPQGSYKHWLVPSARVGGSMVQTAPDRSQPHVEYCRGSHRPDAINWQMPACRLDEISWQDGSSPQAIFSPPLTY